MSPAARFVLQMTAVSVWVLRQVSVLLSSLTADWIQNGCSECVQGICSIRFCPPCTKLTLCAVLLEKHQNYETITVLNGY